MLTSDQFFLNGSAADLKNLQSPLQSEQFEASAKQAVEKLWDNDAFICFSATIPFEDIDPLAVLEILAKPGQLQYYWEHPEERLSIAAGKSIKSFTCNKNGSADRFSYISSAISDFCENIVEFSSFRHSLAGVHFLGGFSFFPEKQSDDWKDFRAAGFCVPEWTFIRDGKLTLFTLNKLILPESAPDAAGLCEEVRKRFKELSLSLQRSTSESVLSENGNHSKQTRIEEESDSRSLWIKNVEAAKTHIKSGELDKIVLSRKLKVKLDGNAHPTRILNQLRKDYPSCYTFMMRPDGDTAFVGSTPERLLSIRSNYILTEGLAGSISRGTTATQDAILEKKLLNSRKDLEEHRYVVDAIEERLRPFSREINHPDEPGIKKFSNVQHLYTPISAWTSDRHDPFSILQALHPTPAVGGVPAERATELIPDYEMYDRGWYAAPFGWVNSKGRGEFIVAIRSGLIARDEALFYAGCGIVQESDPEKEWEETKLKLIPMLSAISHA